MTVIVKSFKTYVFQGTWAFPWGKFIGFSMGNNRVPMEKEFKLP